MDPAIPPVADRLDIEHIIRRELQSFINKIPTSPLTLTFGIVLNTPGSQNSSYIGEIYIATEIEEHIVLLSRLQKLYDSGHLRKLETENKSIVVSKLVYKLYRFDLKNYSDFSSLEKINQKMFPLTPFLQFNSFAILSERNVYPSNWNEHMCDLRLEIYSLLIKVNITAYILFMNIGKSGMSNFISRNWPLIVEALPEIHIRTSHVTEEFPAYPSRDSFHFVTCAPSGKTGPLLTGLVSAFDSYVWICIFISAAISTLVSHYNEKYSGLSMAALCSHKIIFIFNVLLCQEVKFKVFKRKLIVVSWIFVGIVVSNAYQGENIGKLSIPLKHVKFSKYSQVLASNFSVYSPTALHWKKYLVDWKQSIVEDWIEFSTLY